MRGSLAKTGKKGIFNLSTRWTKELAGIARKMSNKMLQEYIEIQIN